MAVPGVSSGAGHDAKATGAAIFTHMRAMSPAARGLPARAPALHLRPSARQGKRAMQIARIETFLFEPGTAKNLLFCRVETDSGLHGWGEAYVTPGKEPVTEHLLRHLVHYITGRDAFSILPTAQVLFADRAKIGFSLKPV